MKSPFSDTSNIITLGKEAVAQIRSITDGNAPSTNEQVMMSAQTGGRHVDTLKCPAWNTAQRTYPNTALHMNDAANPVTRNVKSVSNA